MEWQSVAVAIIVLGAVAFLVRRIVGRRRPSTGAETFVPIDRIRRRDDNCH